MSSFDELYKKLNQKQKEAVDHVDGPMMVIAGAGTGKTQVLAMRIGNLMRLTGVTIGNILCLTFTDAGVSAMRERLIRILGNTGYSAKVATFHSFSNEVIADYPEKFTKSSELLPVTELEQMRILATILDTLPYNHPLRLPSNSTFYLSDILSKVAELKRESISPERLLELTAEQALFAQETAELFERLATTHARELGDSTFDEINNLLTKLGSEKESDYLYRSGSLLLLRGLQDATTHPTKTGKVSYANVKKELGRFYKHVAGNLDKQQALAEVYRAYLDQLEVMGRYDFEDMISNVLHLLQTDTEMRLDFQERYQYVLVDEYQDTNTAQNRLVDVFGTEVESPNLFVVGDDDQAIFRFQGASLENVVSFQRKYSDSVKIVALTDNYRSQPTVLEVAEKLIANNQFRAAVAIPNLIKALQPASGRASTQIRVAEFDSVLHEQFWIVQEIKQLLSAGVPGREIAVLTRTNNELMDLIPLLKQYSISFALSRSENALDNILVNHFIRLILAVHNPFDDVNMFYLLESSLSGIEPLDFLKIHDYVKRHMSPKPHYFDILGNHKIIDELKLTNPATITILYQLILGWRESLGKLSVMEFIGEMIDRSSILDLCQQEGEREIENLRALGAFVQIISDALKANTRMTFEEIVQMILDTIKHDLAIGMGERTGPEQAVVLSTVHKSKGLEYEHVFIMNCVERKWEKHSGRDRLSLPLTLFKNDLGVAARESTEEARRLFYVALTRAKHGLTVTFANCDVGGRKQLPSGFLNEMQSTQLLRAKILLSEEHDRELFRLRMSGLKRDVGFSAEVEAFLRERLANYTLSASHLNAYIKCPRMFYYQYFIRAPIVPNMSLVIGSAAHSAVEALFSSNLKGNPLSMEQMREIYTKEIDRSLLAGNERAYRDALERGRDFLSKYYLYRADSLPKNIFIEYDFRSHAVHLDGIRLTGKLDMVEITDRIAKRCTIYDFKTGSAKNGIEKVAAGKDIWRQVVFYKMLTQLSSRFGYVMDRGIIEFIEPYTDGTFETVELIVSDADVDVVKQQIREMWDGLQRLNFACLDESGECQYCENILRVGDGLD